MGLFRLLFLIILFAAAFWLWHRVMRKRPTDQKTEQTTLPMVRCAQCGVHVPRTQALENQDRWYCSRAHLEQDNSSDH